jgi:hypothetical protein
MLAMLAMVAFAGLLFGAQVVACRRVERRLNPEVLADLRVRVDRSRQATR